MIQGNIRNTANGVSSGFDKEVQPLENWSKCNADL